MSAKIILVFLVAAIWDMALRLYATAGPPDKPNLTSAAVAPYFRLHPTHKTLFYSGIVAVVANLLITMIMREPEKLLSVRMLVFLLTVFVVSGSVGFALEKLDVVPGFVDANYRKLGHLHSFATDGSAGLVIELTVFALHHMF